MMQDINGFDELPRGLTIIKNDFNDWNLTIRYADRSFLMTVGGFVIFMLSVGAIFILLLVMILLICSPEFEDNKWILGLFFLPFFLVAFVMLKIALFIMGGYDEISFREDGFYVFRGIGFWGRKKFFLWDEVGEINIIERKNKGIALQQLELIRKNKEETFELMTVRTKVVAEKIKAIWEDEFFEYCNIQARNSRDFL